MKKKETTSNDIKLKKKLFALMNRVLFINQQQSL